MSRVIVLDSIADEGLALLDAADGIEYEVSTGWKKKPIDELCAKLQDFDAAICRSGVNITAEALVSNRRLKAIARAGVGTDNIDKEAAKRLGIIVMNTPTGNTLSTAEHAFTLMLALSRNVAPANQSLVEGRWDRGLYMGAQLADKTLGVVGLGRIGQEVAKRALAFEMRVIGYDPFFSAEQAKAMGIEMYDSVEEMLPHFDYLTVHTPLTPETRDLIGIPQIEKMRPGVRLVNCARGGIYNEAALAEGLKSGKLGGVALDVYENEPCTDSPLFGMPGVLCTPHLGASTEEAQTQVAVEAVHLILNYLKTGEIRHAVNMAAIDPKTLESMRGYIGVAHRLGLFLSQWHGRNVESCNLQYRGEVTEKNTKLLTSAFCAGLLERALDEGVNIVNADVLLQERGIKINEESIREMATFSSSISAEVVGDGRTYSAAGTLFGNDMPRLIRLGEHRLEAYLDGNLLLFAHDDQPGIIGKVGNVCGSYNVNIAQMAVGRAGAAGGEAIGVLNLDSVPPEEAIQEILAGPGVHRVKVVTMPPAGTMPSWLQ